MHICFHKPKYSNSIVNLQIFTNSDRIHATKALDRLGIRDCFEQIVCFETLNPNLAKSTRPNEFPVVLKPSLDAFRIAIDVAEIDPRRTVRRQACFNCRINCENCDGDCDRRLSLNDVLFCFQLFLDDSVRNVAAGKAVGLRTTLVSLKYKSEKILFWCTDTLRCVIVFQVIFCHVIFCHVYGI